METEPTDEEIDPENNEDLVELTEESATELNEILTYFQNVLIAHEQAINTLATFVFGAANGSQLPDEGATESTDGDAQNNGQIITVDFGKPDSTDES